MFSANFLNFSDCLICKLNNLSIIKVIEKNLKIKIKSELIKCKDLTKRFKAKDYKEYIDSFVDESVITYEGTHDIHLLILGNEITGHNAF